MTLNPKVMTEWESEQVAEQVREVRLNHCDNMFDMNNLMVKRLIVDMVLDVSVCSLWCHGEGEHTGSRNMAQVTQLIAE